MADQVPNPKKPGAAKKRVRKGVSSQEFVQRLDAIAKSYPAARLLVDLARDAGLETFGKQANQITRLARELVKAKKKRHALHDRLVEVLHELATGTVELPHHTDKPARSHEELEEVYRQFKSHDFPALAQTLHDEIGRGDIIAFQRFLADEILITGSRILVEHLLRHAGQPHTAESEAEFHEQLRDHIAGNVMQGLARKLGYQMTTEVGQLRDALVDRAITFLGELLTAEPPARLLIALPDSPFDPERHEPIHGRPSTGELTVTATLFPGYLVRDNPERIVAKAQVYTERLNFGH